jgi:molybdopterin-guanine dinucleotide biosynthesis protein A
MMANDVTFCLLAGGKSSRFGSDKRLARLKGKTIVDHIIEKLSKFDGDIVISTYKSDSHGWHFKIIEDENYFCGPVCGIEKVVKSVDSKNVIFLAADMPFVSCKMIEGLLLCINSSDVCFFKCGGVFYPLPFVIRRDAAFDYFKTNNCRDRSIKEFISYYASSGVIEWKRCDEFFNINKREDLLKAEYILDLRT